MINQAPELIRVASRLSPSDVEALVLVIEVSQPGLSRTGVRNVIEALATAGRKLNAGSTPKEVEDE
jgi:hypothetical protein